ncbi:MAG: hypothetical protein U1F43_35960 [Myxococcota bacterium]
MIRSLARVFVAAAPALVASGLLGGSARADMDEWQLGLGGDYRGLVLSGDPDDLVIHGPGIAAGLWYGVDDYWQLGASAQLGVGLPSPGDPGFLGSVALEARYVLDIVEWVPHVTAAVGALFDGVGDGRVDVLAGIGGGLDYRPERDWGFGIDLRYDFILTDLDGVTSAFHGALVYSSFF